MDATYHAIVATVVFFILGVHLAVLFALTSQLQVNVVRVVAHGVPVMLGLALIIVGNLLPRLRPNVVIGIRTSRTLSKSRRMGPDEPNAGYAAVGAGASFLSGRSSPESSVMELRSGRAYRS
jgi:hypothetical protein